MSTDPPEAAEARRRVQACIRSKSAAVLGAAVIYDDPAADAVLAELLPGLIDTARSVARARAAASAPGK